MHFNSGRIGFRLQDWQAGSQAGSGAQHLGASQAGSQAGSEQELQPFLQANKSFKPANKSHFLWHGWQEAGSQAGSHAGSHAGTHADSHAWQPLCSSPAVAWLPTMTLAARAKRNTLPFIAQLLLIHGTVAARIPISQPTRRRDALGRHPPRRLVRGWVLPWDRTDSESVVLPSGILGRLPRFAPSFASAPPGHSVTR